MAIRLGGGDLNALIGLAGFVAGISVGVIFLKRGFNMGRAQETKGSDGWMLPAVMILFLLFLLLKINFNREAGGPIFFSVQGPGAMTAPIAFSLIGGLLVGGFAQRSRFCTVGGVRDFILFKDTFLLTGLIVLFLTVLVGDLAFGLFKLGFNKQPIAHNWHLWNFLGMTLGGWGSVLLGGCPLRQLVLSANGNTDSAITVLGMLIGAAFAHNFVLAASPKGVPVYGQIAVVIGLFLFLIVSIANREKI